MLFLVRDADYITGQVIPVDGGRLLNHSLSRVKLPRLDRQFGLFVENFQQHDDPFITVVFLENSFQPPERAVGNHHFVAAYGSGQGQWRVRRA